jgi:hypothetical protein
MEINLNGIITDVKELLAAFIPYVEYLCIFPRRYLLSNCENTYETTCETTCETKSKTCTLFVTNESTREKIVLKDIYFDEKTEIVKLFENTEKNEKNEFSLTMIVQNITDLLNWKFNEQIIIATNGTVSFSYGIEYYCIRDISGNVIDICVKSHIDDSYIPTNRSYLKEKEYNYFDLIKI